jgi:hypothetical protein
MNTVDNHILCSFEFCLQAFRIDFESRMIVPKTPKLHDNCISKRAYRHRSDTAKQESALFAVGVPGFYIEPQPLCLLEQRLYTLRSHSQVDKYEILNASQSVSCRGIFRKPCSGHQLQATKGKHPVKSVDC